MEYSSEILNFINEIVLVVNDNYQIQYCSPQVKQLTGKGTEKMKGKKCHMSLFNKMEPCKDCQLVKLKENKIPVDMEHDTITHRGFRKLFSAKFFKLEDNAYAEIMSDITSTKKLIDKLTRHSKELKASNVILNLKRKETEKEHRFILRTINSLNDGVMVINPDLTINISNSSLAETCSLEGKNIAEMKCYEVYGYHEQCPDCPLLDPKNTRAFRQAHGKKLTVTMNHFDKYIVESLRDTTKELKLIDEIKTQQDVLHEKQRQMSLLNEDLLRMNDKLKVAHKIIDEELTQVGEIQSSLLPETLPQIEGYDFGAFYVPAEHAGGDYYDCIEMSNGYWGLGVADVSGHGIPASVIMAITRAIMRSYTYDIISSSEAVAMVNEILCENIHTNDFVTMFYTVFNSKKGVLNYASAGHNPLLFYDKSEMLVKKISCHGMFLGAFDVVEYEEGELEIDDGDIVFLYTDGLNEAMSRSREQYGYDRLISKIMMFSSLPVSEMIENIMEDVVDFTQGHPFEDDITILAFKKL
ncbi:MAG: diguanylate cyclase [Denitrovibrio sp.]|nr:MAG: diguanylate cyclase [Denitrovibrio sp.]